MGGGGGGGGGGEGEGEGVQTRKPDTIPAVVVECALVALSVP